MLKYYAVAPTTPNGSRYGIQLLSARPVPRIRQAAPTGSRGSARSFHPSCFNVYQLSNDCNGDKLKLHSPNCDRRHVILELHDRLKLQLLGSKHNVHRHARKLHDVKVGLRDDMEFLQIYLI